MRQDMPEQKLPTLKRQATRPLKDRGSKQIQLTYALAAEEALLETDMQALYLELQACLNDVNGVGDGLSCNEGGAAQS
eukprot:scaffold60162_cov18-Tisochrysis_lutea.AAC.2